MSSGSRVGSFQELAYPEGYDYSPGSPHLQHAQLRSRVESSLVDEARRMLARHGRCRVLEVGAGHGHFTRVLREAGGSVTVTEMSEPSAQALRRSFAGDANVVVVHDPDGSWASDASSRFELVAAISVLHHIPDYLGAVAAYADITVEGGSFVSWQDPLWYPRRPKATRAASKAAYLTWRLGQGNWARGLATLRRRLRGVLDENEVSDMSEYHVVRQGVNEEALVGVLSQQFGETLLTPYWSTQASVLQRAGTRIGFVNTFSLRARDRNSTTSGQP